MSGKAGWRPLSKPTWSGAGGSAFNRLSVAHALSAAGDTLVTMALAGSLFFSISPTAARNRVALYLLLTMAPFALVAPFLGPLLDRNPGGRRMMAIVANGGRTVACALMARHINGLLLFPEAFVVLVLSKAYMVTKSALVPATVGGEGRLVEANARLAVLSVVAGFAAALPGAALLKIGFLGAPWVMRLAAVVFAGAAVASFRLVRTTKVAVTVPPDRERAELAAATVRLGATATAVLRGVVGFLIFLTAFSLRRSHAPSWWFGVVLAASMVGSFLGAVVAPWLRRKVPEERILGGSLVMVTIAAAVAAQVDSRAGLAAFAAVVGISAAAGKLAFDSIVQRDAPDAVRGRTFARFETRFQLVWVTCAAIPVVIPIPIRAGLALVALGTAVAFVSYALGLSARHGNAAAAGAE